MAGVGNIGELRALLCTQGIRTAWVKKLSSKQDNQKNQIYLGGGLDGVTNLFPATLHARSPSESIAKRGAKPGQPKLEARLDFAWLDRAGNRHDAPRTRIIDYFQYPEVRMSGFLAGCDAPPDALRRESQARYGQRILVMGTAADGATLPVVFSPWVIGPYSVICPNVGTGGMEMGCGGWTIRERQNDAARSSHSGPGILFATSHQPRTSPPR